MELHQKISNTPLGPGDKYPLLVNPGDVLLRLETPNASGRTLINMPKEVVDFCDKMHPERPKTLYPIKVYDTHTVV